jgi:hypothetical protein
VPITERDKRRLDALIAIVKPANSLAARIDSLTDDQRNYYDEWKAHCDRWNARCKAQCDDDDEREGRPYARTLDGFGPDLRDDIYTALYGPKPIIPFTATNDDAARIYKDYCDDGLLR